jgi:FkbM family methyltransferase
MRLPGIVKRLTTPLVGRVPVTIAGGPNRGMKWSLASSGNGFRRGMREPQRMVFLDALVHPEDVVWDVGAHYGYVALLMARRVGPTGRLHAFEPARRSRWYLSRHMRWNGLANVTVHPYALSDFDGASNFGGSDSSQLFALGGGDERVQVRRGTTLVRSGACAAPTFLKVDVEGAEASVLKGALEVLPQDARAFVATHSQEEYDACVSLMASAGFTSVASTEIGRAARERGGRWPGDPDVFFHGPGYAGADEDLRRLRENGF